MIFSFQNRPNDTMQFSEPKVLISQSELTRLLNLSKEKETPSQDNTPVKVQKLNENFLKKKQLDKFQTDQQWDRLNYRLRPILSSSLSSAQVPNSLDKTTTDSSFKKTSVVDDEDDTVDETMDTSDRFELVDYIESNLPKSMVGRGLLLYKILLKHPEIRITKDKIFVNDERLPSNTINIFRHLIGKSKNLHYDLLPLLRVLSLEHNDQLNRIIGNKEANSILKERVSFDERLAVTSTPRLSKSARKRKSRRKKDDDDEDDDDDDLTFMEAKDDSFTSAVGSPSSSTSKRGSGESASSSTTMKWRDFFR